MAARAARRVGLGEGVERGLNEIFEWWNGKGAPRGLRGEAIAPSVRIAQVAAQASVFDQIGGPELAVRAVTARAGKSLDPEVAASFCGRAGEILRELSSADVLKAAVEAEPAPAVTVSGDGLDDVCRAFGDAVDLKSPFHHGHSAGVAELAAGAGERLALDADALRRAALLHDIGLDGSGYHRQAAAAAIPMTARVLAAADVFQAATQERAHRPARNPEAAAGELSAEAAAGRLDADAANAVIAAAGQRAARVQRPAGLTDRQVEVLRLLARGLSNPEIARELVVSRRTAEHHVQDIYARIGVSSRAAAALFAMENDLLT